MSIDFNRWIRQPTTLHGLGVLAAGIGVALSAASISDPTFSLVVGWVAYVLVHLGVDDNSATEQSADAMTKEMISTLNGGQVPGLSQLVAQIGDIAVGLQPAISASSKKMADSSTTPVRDASVVVPS